MIIINMIEENAVQFWVILGVLLVIIEEKTKKHLAICFAIGAVCALISIFTRVSLGTQSIIFIAVSLAALLIARKLFVKK